MSPNSIPFDDLAQYLLSRAADLVPRWLPGGHMAGREYCSADISGGAGKSMKVNMETGAWKDFGAMGLQGRDLISLYAAQQGLKNGEAALRLMKDTGYDTVNPSVSHLPVKTEPAPAKSVSKASKPPKDAPLPNFGERNLTNVCLYKDFDGSLIGYIARYDPPGQRKVIIPFTWNGQGWEKKAFPAPRPLCQLDRLAAYPTAPVLIVEGEVKGQKAQLMVGDRYVVTWWQGGAAAEAKTDFSVLRGREVLLWPDCDADKRYPETHPTMANQRLPYESQPGPAVMQRISQKLASICPIVKLIDLKDMYDLFGQEGGVKDGWDVADAVAEGWGWERFFTWAKPRATLIQAPALAVLKTANPVPAKQPPVLATTPDSGMIPHNVQGLWMQAGIIRLSSGHALCNVDNVLRLMDVAPEFKVDEGSKVRPAIWWDDFHQKVFTTWGRGPGEAGEWREVDTLNLLVRFQRDFGFRRVSDDVLFKAVVTYAHGNRRSEPREWMEGLVWDRKERVFDFWQRYFGVPLSGYNMSMAMNFWISMVARVYDPACQSDHMVILHGPEGVGKSTALSVIGGKWYTAMMLDLSKIQAFLEVLPGKMIVEISELDAFRKADANTIKKITSNREDRYRAAYGRTATDFKRQCIFVGTTNENDFLGGTGSKDRRFWPVTVLTVRLKDLEVDREQLFAEAVHYYKAGRHWWDMPEETDAERDLHREIDPWEEVIREGLMNTNQTTLSFIGSDILGVAVNRQDGNFSKHVSKLLRKLGFVTTVIKDSATGQSVRVWQRMAQSDLLGE